MATNGSTDELRERRWRLLHRLEDWLEAPMVVLGFVWLVLLVLELTRGIGPLLEGISTAIWVAFILDFLLRLTLAPRRLDYLRRNWLTVVALVLPALRILRVARAFRALRALRAARGVRLVRIVGSLNRGMRALGRSMSRRGLEYVLALTALVVVAGAAGMYAFERLPDGTGLRSYGEALWWTAMLITTIGSEYWPRTAEGRLLAFLLSAYALGVLGYITAALASFFVGRDAAAPDGEVAGEESLRALRDEVAGLREELRALAAASGRRAARQDPPVVEGGREPG